MPTTPSSLPAARLRALLDQGGLAMPGAFNGLCARAVARAGFKAAYISGAATSVCAGVPDVGLLTLDHFARVIREVHNASGLPLIADADTGFGEAEMVRRTVIDYARAGAAGLHLEDQQFPKRCGHLDGKALVPADHMIEKMTWAAKAARDLPGGDSPATRFVICARTDARGVEGFDAAVARAAAYVAAGADMIFPEGLTSEQEFADFAARLRSATGKSQPAMGAGTSTFEPRPAGRGAGAAGPQTGRESHGGATPDSPFAAPYLLANMTEFGKTPIIPLDRFRGMGYAAVIYPVSLLRVAMGAVDAALAQLKAHGSVEPFLGSMQTRKDLYALIDYTPGTPWETPAR